MIRTNIDFLTYLKKLQLLHPHYFSIENYTSKEVILKDHKKYQSLYIIHKGIAKCYFTDENGKESIQEFFGEGMQFGELEVFNNQLSYCSTEAITDVEVFKISHQHYLELLENDAAFNRLVIQSMVAKISYKAPRLSFQQSYSIEQNILKLKELYPNYDAVFSKKDIADYLGITLRSLNRVLNSLR